MNDFLLTAENLYDARERELPLSALLEHAEGGNGTVSVGDTTMSWAEFAQRVRRRAGGLLDIGVETGDRVASLMADRIECLELLMAVAAVGAVWVPIGPFLKGRFLKYQLDDSQPRVLVVDRPGWAEVAGVLAEVPTVTHVVHVDSSDGLPDLPAVTVAWSALCSGAGDVTCPPIDGRATAAILYTSGTTGPSKGCLMSHGYFVKSGAAYGRTFGVRTDDVLHSAFPLFHGAAMAIVMMAMNARASFRSPGHFSASGYLADVRRTDATVVIGAGAMAQALLAQQPDEHDRVHKLRLAEWIPLPPNRQQAFTERFGVKTFGEHYGQTECMILTISDPDGPRSAGSLGKASLLVDVAVVDEDGHQLPAGERGEIVIRPKTDGAMYGGYWRKPDSTIHAWRGLWHHTGDMGMMDGDGFVYFVDRRDDAIRRRGENVSSLELEVAILDCPAVAEVAVHAVPSEMTEEDIKACIVLVPGVAVSPAELFAFFKKSMPYFAIPRYVEVMDALPRTANMKVRKADLRQRGNGPSTWDFVAMNLEVGRDERRAGADFVR